MIRVGMVSERRYVIPGRKWEFECFEISPLAPTFRQIFHSAFATPARYLLEILRRLQILDAGRAEWLFVFNPLFQLGPIEIWLVLAKIESEVARQAVVIVADSDGYPLGYGFPCRYAVVDALSLLSTVDAALDARLCEKLLSLPVRRLTIASIRVTHAQNNGFVFKENIPIYNWVARHALDTLEACGTSQRQEMAFTAIMTHHAGDVLFFDLAWRHTETPVTGIAVNRAYAPIVSDIAPGLEAVLLDIPIINRSEEFNQGKITTEGEYFQTIKAALPANRFYFYLRPSRNYSISRFHLIDHFAFALGRHYWNADDLLTLRRPLPRPTWHDGLPGQPVRILLAFDAGWPLKIYPRHLQQQLVNLLHQRGFSVTVLAPAGHNYLHCSVIRFESYARLKTILGTQHLMVGMDSFPTHLATYVLGVPTLCLFGNTRPENSNAPSAPHYRYLENGLNCRPCHGIAKCPLYGGGNCANFVSPVGAIEAIDRMLHEVGTMSPTSSTAEQHHADSSPVFEQDTRPYCRLSIDQRVLKAPLYALAVQLRPSFGFLRQARIEFMISLRRDGWRQTYLRSLRYLRRSLRSLFGR